MFTSLPHNRVHLQGGMVFFLKICQNGCLIRSHGLIGDPVDEDRARPVPFRASIKTFLEFFLQGFGHPHHPKKAAVAGYELSLGQVELAVTHEPGGGLTAAHDAGEGGELHTARGLARVVPMHTS